MSFLLTVPPGRNFLSVLLSVLAATTSIAAQAPQGNSGGTMTTLANQVVPACTGGDRSKCDQLLQTVLRTAEAEKLGGDSATREVMVQLLALAPSAQKDPFRYLEWVLKILGPDAKPDQFTQNICGQVAARSLSPEHPEATNKKLAAIEKSYPFCEESFDEIRKITAYQIQVAKNGYYEPNPLPAPASAATPAEKLAYLAQQSRAVCMPTGNLPARPGSRKADPAKCDDLLEQVLTLTEKNNLGADPNFRSSITLLLQFAPYASLERLRYHERVLKILAADGKPDTWAQGYCMQVATAKMASSQAKGLDEVEKRYPICKEAVDFLRQILKASRTPPTGQPQTLPKEQLGRSQEWQRAMTLANKGDCDVLADVLAKSHTYDSEPEEDRAEELAKARKTAEQICQAEKAAVSAKKGQYADLQKLAMERSKELQVQPKDEQEVDAAQDAAFLIMTGNETAARKYVLLLEKSLAASAASGGSSLLETDEDAAEGSPFGAISQRSYAYSLAVVYHLRVKPADEEIARNALQLILSQKNRDLDRETSRMQAFRAVSQGSGSKLAEHLAKKYDSVNRFTAEYAKISHAWAMAAVSCKKISDSQFLAMSTQVDQLEAVLDYGRPDSGTQLGPRVNDVQKGLGPNDALVEFAEVFLPEYKPGADPPFEYLKKPDFHYVAYVLRADEAIHGYDLGRAPEIDKEISTYRSVMNLAAQKKQRLGLLDDSAANESARKLYRLLWKPLLPALNGVKGHVYLSPDGELALLPFDALLSDSPANAHYAIEDWSISYLTSGRDLAAKKPPTRGSGVAIFADPISRGETVQKGGIAASKGSAASNDSGDENGNAARSACLTTKYEELGNALIEGKAVYGLLKSVQLPDGQPQLFAGGEATEARLKAEKDPKVLHLATHAYYMNPTGPVTSSNVDENRIEKEKYGFLRSGLIMNEFERSNSREDGIVTALEIALLNLNGTSLVVLSACDSGVGDTTPGDNVAGMRTAFHIAGARAVISSLWSVDDVKGEQIMTQLYEGLMRGETPGDALRQAKLAVLKAERHQHAFYWAPFVLEGQDEPLFPHHYN